MGDQSVLLRTGDSGILWFAILSASFVIAVFAPIVLMFACSCLAQILILQLGGKLVQGTIEAVSLSHLTVVYSSDDGTSSFRACLPIVARDKRTQEGQEVTLLLPYGLPRRPMIWKNPCQTFGVCVACLLVFWFLNPVHWGRVQSIDVVEVQLWLFVIISGLIVFFKGSEQRTTAQATTIVTASSPTAPCIEMTTTTTTTTKTYENMTETDLESTEQENSANSAYEDAGNGSVGTNILFTLASMR